MGGQHRGGINEMCVGGDSMRAYASSVGKGPEGGGGQDQVIGTVKRRYSGISGA